MNRPSFGEGKSQIVCFFPLVSIGISDILSLDTYKYVKMTSKNLSQPLRKFILFIRNQKIQLIITEVTVVVI